MSLVANVLDSLTLDTKTCEDPEVREVSYIDDLIFLKIRFLKDETLGNEQGQCLAY